MLLRTVYVLALAIAALAASDESDQHGKPSPPSHPSKPEPPSHSSKPSKPEPSHPSKPEPSKPSKPEPSKPSKPGLEQIKHVVWFMQENRAFDHYFGTLHGVRGFLDPNVQSNPDDVKDGLPNVFYQHVDSTLTNETNFLLPFYINAQGGNSSQATQCAGGGTNSLEANLAALNEGENNMWPIQNQPSSMAYFRRDDLPIHFTIADSWTVADMHQEAMIAATHPNRCYWGSGSAGLLGGNVPPGQGGPSMDDNGFPGGEKLGLDKETIWNVFPYKWNTTADYLEAAGVSWFVYQPNRNFVDMPYVYFKTFQDAINETAAERSPMAQKGLTISGEGQLDYIDAFKRDAMHGNLSSFSIIVPQDQLTEHPPNGPRDGSWQQKAVIEALLNSPSYKNTAIFVTYDETGGWYDHVPPFHSPNFTAGEWLINPFTLKPEPAGPGFRVPSYVISPWTRGGHVFTEKCDHTSHIQFLEKWVEETMGKNIFSRELNDWRREHMCDYTNIFDFENPDFSVPDLPTVAFPHFDNATQMFDGSTVCEAMFPDPQPIIPYGQQNPSTALATEAGHRATRGILTEGRYLVIQEPGSSNRGLGVSSTRGRSTLSSFSVPTKKETEPSIRFIIYELGTFPDMQYQIQSAFLKNSAKDSSSYLGSDLEFTTKSEAATFAITYTSDGTSYSIQVTSSKKYISISSGGQVTLSSAPYQFSVFAITF